MEDGEDKVHDALMMIIALILMIPLLLIALPLILIMKLGDIRR